MLAEVYDAYALPVARAAANGFVGQGRTGRYRIAGVTSPFELDDVVQETFLRAFTPRAREAYDGVQPFLRYLTAIARNLLIDRGRKTRRRGEELAPSGVLEDEQHAATSPAPDPEAELVAAQLRRLYAAFLASLTPADRSLWQLRVEQEEPRRSIEVALGLSPMQVRTREARLRAELLRRLEHAGYRVPDAVLAMLLLAAVLS